MSDSNLAIVTGAFGYTGRYITSNLLSRSRRVRTLTEHPESSSPLAGQVEIAPFNFDQPDLLTKSLEGADCVFNTYWIRFPYKGITHQKAAVNLKILIDCARRAGVRRFVQISITNASLGSPLPYFKGKGEVEEALIASGLSYAILRPAVIFGPEDILLNNIAWLLRKFPAFAIPGSGKYRLRPIFVEDLAALALEAGEADNNIIVDAVGPETYTFDQLVRFIADAIGSKALLFHLSPRLALLLSKVVGGMVGDVILTADEITGLTADLLLTTGPATAKTRFSDWLNQHKDSIGVSYASELARRRKP